MATDLYQDTELLTKISDGLTATKDKYHLCCLIALRNKHCSFIRQIKPPVDLML